RLGGIAAGSRDRRGVLFARARRLDLGLARGPPGRARDVRRRHGLGHLDVRGRRRLAAGVRWRRTPVRRRRRAGHSSRRDPPPPPAGGRRAPRELRRARRGARLPVPAGRPRPGRAPFRELLRRGARGLRRLPAQAGSPRLGRRALPRDPPQLPPCSRARRAAAGSRIARRALRRAGLRIPPRPPDARRLRGRPRARAGGIPRAPRRGRFRATLDHRDRLPGLDPRSRRGLKRATVQPGRDRQLVTVAVMLGMFLAALEATAVAAAVPTAVGTMGGVARYSWVFSAYLLTSTTTVPLYGKLADLFGRRRIYLFSVALFLLGSALSGLSASLVQLIVFRGIQGLGAGGLMPVAATVIGDIFSLEERGRMQGLFSSVWAFASLVGPLAGGLLTDALSWRWIFFINIPFGLASAWLLERHLKEEPPRREHRLDVLGTVLLTITIALLLLALIEGPEIWGWRDPKTLAALAGALAAGIGFVIQERHAP